MLCRRLGQSLVQRAESRLRGVTPAARVRGHDDLAVRHVVHRPVGIAQHRPSRAEVLDYALHPGNADVLTGVVLVLGHDEDAGKPVLDRRLGAEADRQSAMPKPAMAGPMSTLNAFSTISASRR